MNTNAIKEQYDLSDDAPNTYGRSEITCPFCGYEQGDSWERNDDSDTDICDGCDKEYKWEREITVEYSSNAPTL